MTEDRLSEVYAARMGANVGAAAVAYLSDQYEELKTPNSEARNKLADFLENQPAELQEKICVLPIKMASVVERMKNPEDITEADADTMQKHQSMYADIHQVIDRTMPAMINLAHKYITDGMAMRNLDPQADIFMQLEYGALSQPEMRYAYVAVYNECLPPQNCDAKQAKKEVEELARNMRAYKTKSNDKSEKEGKADKSEESAVAFGGMVRFMEQRALQTSQAMKILGEILPDFGKLPSEERGRYVALTERYPQEVKVAAYVAQARGEVIDSIEVLQERLHQPEIILASRVLEENAVTPTADSIQKAMFVQKAVRIMREDMKQNIELQSSEGKKYLETAQKFGEAALVACCLAADKGETIKSPMDLTLKSTQAFKLLSYMHDEKVPSRRLTMNNLDNAVQHVSSQQKTYQARQMLQGLGYSLG